MTLYIVHDPQRHLYMCEADFLQIYILIVCKNEEKLLLFYCDSVHCW